ncbi:MAG: hypothetical protein Q9170_003102 [Blastenia crenularia]
MPDEDALFERSHTDHRSRTIHRWREKLSNRESKGSKDSQNRSQEIQSFLNAPSSGRTAPTPPNPKVVSELDSSEIQELYSSPSPPQTKRKSPRRPNLHVNFVATSPIIFGEGGDEATLPVTELLPSFALLSGASAEASEASDPQPLGTPPVGVNLWQQNIHDDSSRPRALLRRSTGLGDHEPNEDFEHSYEPTDPPQTQSSARPALHPELSSDSLEENTRRLPSIPIQGSRPTDGNLSGETRKSDDLLNREALNEQNVASGSLRLPLLDPATSFANSLTPLPSPQPQRSRNVSPNSNPSLSAAQLSNNQATASKSLKQNLQQPPGQTRPKLVTENRGLSLRTVAKGLGDDASLDFASRVQHYRNVFLLGLGTRPEPTLQQWVTAACWWFVKGRSELESSVRSQSQSAASSQTTDADIPLNLKQAYVDLAKTSWVVSEMTPAKHPEVKRLENQGLVPISAIMRSFVDIKTSKLIQIHLSIVSNLRALIISMKRNSRLPPYELELQGLDTRIFVDYPLLSPSAARLLSLEDLEELAPNKGAETASFFTMPIADTERHFNYGRMFVDVILNQNKAEYQISMPCLLTVLRDKKEQDITIVAASQDGQVCLVVRPSAKMALSWQDIRWKTTDRCMEVEMRADFSVRIQFTDKDFRTIWGIHDYIRAVQKQSQGARSEALLFETVLRSFQYFDPRPDASHFPTEPIEGCELRLFECFRPTSENVGRRKIHDGYRLVAVTPRNIKTLRSVNHNLGQQNPIIFSYLRGEHGAPALLWRMSKSSRDPSMVISFQQEADRELLYSLLNGTKLSSDEYGSDTLRLENCMIMTDLNHEKSRGNQAGLLGSLNWQRLQVLGQRGQQLELGGPTIRICAECDMGSIADRINLGPGELQMRLDCDCEKLHRIDIARGPQNDMTVCFADNTLSKEQYDGLRQMLDFVARSPSLRVFDFRSLNDLHTFQTLITGFSVLFDGFAKSFAISRRRMVVPIYKRWEASMTRLQMVRHDKTFQLVAFFQDFSHGSCMNFVLKSTDVFESFSRSGMSYICIVDAKFALPKEATDPNHQFVSLGMPEYPGEHDDITIGFETQHASFLVSVRFADEQSESLESGVKTTLGPDDIQIDGRSSRMGDMHTTELDFTEALRYAPCTRAIHADDGLDTTPDVAPPLHVSTTFRYDDSPRNLIPASDAANANSEAHVYSRLTAPNATRFEKLLSSLLNAPCLTYSSGLSALHAAYVCLNPKRVSIGGGYHGSHGVLVIHQKLCGTGTLALDCPASELSSGDVVHLETPLNPSGEAYNIKAYAEKAHSRGAILLVDATFGPPGLQDPFEWGADIVMHSGTKYLGGHSDMLCGVLATRNQAWLAELMNDRMFLGSVMGSMEGWLGVRSLRTLDLRVRRQSESTSKLVQWLDSCTDTDSEDTEAALVQAIIHSVQHASLQREDMHWLKKQMPHGFGPVFAFWVKEEWMARQLPSLLSLFHHATSLGAVESSIEWRSMSDKTVDRRVLRVSVGVEDWEDLKADLLKAFQSLIETKIDPRVP